LLYYDIFNYPLTNREILFNLSTNHVSLVEVNETLRDLSANGYIFQWNEFFSVQNNESLIERRKKGNEEAKRYLRLAERKGKFIYSFPFVRAVMASGSFSKNYMDDTSDLDFFVITEPGRLWISRMLLILYKRIFLFNSHKYFCVNYLIDSAQLEIEEKNIFTATELSTLVPLCGNEYYPLLIDKNQWLKKFLPNYQQREIQSANSHKYHFKRLSEKIIDLFGADKIDSFFMNITQKRWEQLYKNKYPENDFKIAFKTKKSASKNHPKYYQKKVVDLYHDKLKQFEKRFNISWLHE